MERRQDVKEGWGNKVRILLPVGGERVARGVRYDQRSDGYTADAAARFHAMFILARLQQCMTASVLEEMCWLMVGKPGSGERSREFCRFFVCVLVPAVFERK